MADPFNINADNLVSPHRKCVEITPNDSTVIDTTKAVYIGGAGVIQVTGADGDVCKFTVPAGTLLPIRVTVIHATNTTATLIVAMY